MRLELARVQTCDTRWVKVDLRRLIDCT